MLSLRYPQGTQTVVLTRMFSLTFTLSLTRTCTLAVALNLTLPVTFLNRYRTPNPGPGPGFNADPDPYFSPHPNPNPSPTPNPNPSPPDTVPSPRRKVGVLAAPLRLIGAIGAAVSTARSALRNIVKRTGWLSRVT